MGDIVIFYNFNKKFEYFWVVYVILKKLLKYFLIIIMIIFEYKNYYKNKSNICFSMLVIMVYLK